MSSERFRIFGFDLIKTISIYLIIFYHLGGIYYGEIVNGKFYLPNLPKICSTVLASSVPLFLMVNGVLMLSRHWMYKQLIFRSAKVLFLLFFWKFLLQNLLCHELLLIEESMVHFWFLRSLSLIYCTQFLLSKYPNFRNFILCFLFLFPFIYNFVGDILVVFDPKLASSSLIHTGFFTLYSFLYYYLGKQLYAIEWSLKACILSISLGFLLINFEVVAMSNSLGILYDGVNSSFPTLGALALSAGLFQLLKNVKAPNCWMNTFVTFIGMNTMGIFIFHVPIIFVLRKFFPVFMEDLELFDAIVFSMIIMIFSAVISFFFRKRVSRFLLSI